ncbi:MAG: hypothetical protein LC734_10340 [Acidobacteria bacterium]|nr:hypothetical protein [Acidobacteriota bacterium]
MKSGGWFAIGLVRSVKGRDESKSVERKFAEDRLRDHNVSVVRRIERTAIESKPHHLLPDRRFGNDLIQPSRDFQNKLFRSQISHRRYREKLAPVLSGTGSQFFDTPWVVESIDLGCNYNLRAAS